MDGNHMLVCFIVLTAGVNKIKALFILLVFCLNLIMSNIPVVFFLHRFDFNWYIIYKMLQSILEFN